MDAGTAAVRRPYALPQFRRPGLPRITIYHIPSFEDCTGWTVYQVHRSKDYVLQSVTWRQPVDSRRIEDLMLGRVTGVSPAPTLEEASCVLDATWFESQFTAFTSIRIPLHTNRPIGLDGESFGVHAPGEFEVEWWCEGPPEWKELIQWTNDCINHFRQAIAA